MDNDNLLTIMTQQTRINQLEQENDDLRAALLEAPNAQMVAFIAAFELEYLSDVGNGQYIHTVWRELKAQHLGEQTTEAE